jgi:RNA polymerase sigma-70 factor (ECF subfamily)
MDAEDLLQDTCVRALAALERAVMPKNLKGWLRVVMRNAWLNTLRARRVHVKANRVPGPERSDSALVGARVTRSQLLRVWGRLPERARSLVVECLLEGEARGIVARRTGLTAGAIEASIYRTRKALREEGLGT